MPSCQEVHEVGIGQRCVREVAPMEVLRAVTSNAASHSLEFSLMHVDVSRAYFHTKAQRPVLVVLLADAKAPEACAVEFARRRLLRKGQRENRIR